MVTTWQKKVLFQEKKTYIKRIFICLRMGNYNFILPYFIFFSYSKGEFPRDYSVNVARVYLHSIKRDIK